jgi:imidazolonepropionase-like amidohydrolase
MKKIGFASLTVAVALTAAEPVTAIKAARMFDGTRDHVTSPGLVVVSGGKITAVGKDAAIPAGAVTIDLGDATLLPGFMDAHTHLSMPFERDYRVAEQALLKKTVAERALDAAENARVTLMAGFTTVRDVGSADYIDVGLRNAIREGRGVKEMLNDGFVPPPIEKKARQAMASLNVTVRKAIARRVKIGLGTDAAVYPYGRNAEEFHLLVDLGMKPVDALKAGTSADADLLGIADLTGTLEAGKLADIVACPGNPEENIRVVEKVFFVMRDGVVFRNR